MGFDDPKTRPFGRSTSIAAAGASVPGGARGPGGVGMSAGGGESADASPALPACVEDFLRARRGRKRASTALARYGRDLEAIGALIAAQAGCEPPELSIDL